MKKLFAEGQRVLITPTPSDGPHWYAKVVIDNGGYHVTVVGDGEWPREVKRQNVHAIF